VTRGVDISIGNEFAAVALRVIDFGDGAAYLEVTDLDSDGSVLLDPLQLASLTATDAAGRDRWLQVNHFAAPPVQRPAPLPLGDRDD